MEARKLGKSKQTSLVHDDRHGIDRRWLVGAAQAAFLPACQPGLFSLASPPPPKISWLGFLPPGFVSACTSAVRLVRDLHSARSLVRLNIGNNLFSIVTLHGSIGNKT